MSNKQFKIILVVLMAMAIFTINEMNKALKNEPTDLAREETLDGTTEN